MSAKPRQASRRSETLGMAALGLLARRRSTGESPVHKPQLVQQDACRPD